MKAIGFRAEKDSIHWAVVSSDGEEKIVYDQGKIGAPKTYSADECLAHFRKGVRERIERYGVSAAGIKFPETGQKAPRYLASVYSRCRIEGVILEAIHSTGTPLAGGLYRTIGKEMQSQSPKQYIETSDGVRGFKFQKKDDKHREAVMAAVAALEVASGRPD